MTLLVNPDRMEWDLPPDLFKPGGNLRRCLCLQIGAMYEKAVCYCLSYIAS